MELQPAGTNEKGFWYAQADKARTHAALAYSAGTGRSGLNPAGFSDKLIEVPQT
jgi:hypothetical protein